MTATRVMALDLGLTATGVAFPDGASDSWRTTGLTGYDRHWWLYRSVVHAVDAHRPGLVVVEQYALGKSSVIRPAELGGVVRMALTLERVAWAAVAPASVKAWATGNGRAEKPEMVAAAEDLTGEKMVDDNEADAVLLRLAVLDALGEGRYRSLLPKADATRAAIMGQLSAGFVPRSPGRPR